MTDEKKPPRTASEPTVRIPREVIERFAHDSKMPEADAEDVQRAIAAAAAGPDGAIVECALCGFRHFCRGADGSEETPTPR